VPRRFFGNFAVWPSGFCRRLLTFARMANSKSSSNLSRTEYFLLSLIPLTSHARLRLNPATEQNVAFPRAQQLGKVFFFLPFFSRLVSYPLSALPLSRCFISRDDLLAHAHGPNPSRDVGSCFPGKITSFLDRRVFCLAEGALRAAHDA